MRLRKRDAHYHTYADYLTWSASHGDEVIAGTAYVREPPAPSPSHQWMAFELSRQIANAQTRPRLHDWGALAYPFGILSAAVQWRERHRPRGKQATTCALLRPLSEAPMGIILRVSRSGWMYGGHSLHQLPARLADVGHIRLRIGELGWSVRTLRRPG
jgi:hypothetical protein